MTRLTIKTKKKKEVVDITEAVEKELKKFKRGGVCHLALLHTTAALSTADLDPGTDLDMLDALYAIIPRHSRERVRIAEGQGPEARCSHTLKYRHPHNPAHVPDHILSALIGTSLSLPAENGKLALGKWQRAVLFEFDGPREREIVVSLT